MVRAALGWLLLLLALSPSVAAERVDGFMIFDADADEIVVRMQVTMTGEDAQEMREEIDDEYGNGDGAVTMDEVARFNAEGTLKFEDDRPECFEGFELALIDGLTPKRLSLLSGRAEKATGSVESIAPINVTGSFTFLYPTRPGPTHSVQVELDEMDSFGEALGCYLMLWAESSFGEWEGAGPPPGCCGEFMEPMDWESYENYAALSQLEAQGAAFESDPYGEDGPDAIRIQPRVGYRIEEPSIAPPEARELWDGKALEARSDTEKLLVYDELITFTVRSGAPPSALGGTVQDVGAYVGFAVMGGGVLTLALGLCTEYGRFKLWNLLFLIPGFTRLEKDEVLEHNKRDELYRFIKQNPGPSFSDLRRELSLSNGTLVHHLRILEAQEYVKGVRDGFRTRFYVRGPRIVMESYLTRTQIQLVDAIGANPGLTQKDLSHLLGLPRESISYHTKQLAAKGRLAIKQEGKWRRYWTSAPAQPAPSLVQM